jgi:hypothetical protein
MLKPDNRMRFLRVIGCGVVEMFGRVSVVETT